MPEKENSKAPEGQRFSHVYLDRGEPTADSDRMRIRLLSLVVTFENLTHSAIVQRELGVEFYSWAEFFKKAKIRDVLCFVTVAYRFFARQQYVGSNAIPAMAFRS
jgi:hypothetical protein